MRGKKVNLRSGDFLLVILTIALVIFGIIMVFSASYYQSINESESGSPYNYLIRDIIWAALGFVLMIITTALDYRIYRKIAVPALIISFVLLVLLLILSLIHI